MLCGLEQASDWLVQFSVHGKPAQMGSKRAFVRNGRAIMANDNSERLKQWYNSVASKAAEVMRGREQITGPVRLSISFHFKRPKSHYGSGSKANIRKPGSPQFHAQSPDLDKLIRCTQDALSAVVWRDDSQVCQYGSVSRIWSDDGVEGAEISVELLDASEIERRRTRTITPTGEGA